MTAPAVDTKREIEALSRAVVGIDSSRRVGWARAFAALRQVDGLSHDLNIANEDRAFFYERLSYTLGWTHRVMKEFVRPGNMLWADLCDILGIDTDPLNVGALQHNQVFEGARRAEDALVELGDTEHEALDDPEAWMLRRAQRRRDRRTKAKQRRNADEPDRVQQEKYINEEAARRVTATARQQAAKALLAELKVANLRELKSIVRDRKMGFIPGDLFGEARKRIIQGLLKPYGLETEEQLHKALAAYTNQRGDAT